MAVHALIFVCIINMIMALYMGFFIPVEYHESFALSAKDYFLLSFTGFCFALLNHIKRDDES